MSNQTKTRKISSIILYHQLIKVSIIFYTANPKRLNIKKIIIVTIISSALVTAEIFGGLMAYSLCVLSHSAFLLSEFLGYEMSIISIILTNVKPSETLSLGFQRSEIIFCVTSVLFIWTLTGILVVESLHFIRDNNSIKLNPELMLYISLFGFVSNCILVNIFHIFRYNQRQVNEEDIYELLRNGKEEKSK